MGTYATLLNEYQNKPLNRGENKNSKKRRIRLLKRKILVLEYNLTGRDIDINQMQ